MQRREVLRILAAGAALNLAPRSLLVTLAEARKLIRSQSNARTLNSHQEATVRTMAELILPRTDTPGASDVGATEFIDLMLTEWYEQPERTLFLNGVADVDSRSNALFGTDFIGCSALQQTDILTALGETLIQEPVPPPGAGGEPPSDPNFYAMLRRLTLTAYYTSEKGATEELHFEIVPGSYEGCHIATPEKGISEQK